MQEAKEVNQEVQRLLDEGVIVPSASEYASPIVPVRRKDGSLRLCVDYRRINRKTIKDRFPLPVIEDQLDKLRDATIFSLVDLRNGFHHITVHPNSRKYTAFITQEAQYEYVKMPFGLSNGPAVFQRFICEIFKELVRLGIILIYLDDLIILAKNRNEAIERLIMVLRIAADYGLEINWKKSEFLKEEIIYLGHHICNNKIRPSERKTKAVMRFPEPNSKKSLRSFLGLTGH